MLQTSHVLKYACLQESETTKFSCAVYLFTNTRARAQSGFAALAGGAVGQEATKATARQEHRGGSGDSFGARRMKRIPRNTEPCTYT